MMEIFCQKCSMRRKLACHDLRHLPREEVVMQCKNECEKICQLCRITSLKVPCRQIEVNCQRMVGCVLQCGHEAKWNCGEDEDPRLTFDSTLGVSSLCQMCSILKWGIDDDLELDAGTLVENCKRLFAEVADVGQSCTIIDESLLVDLLEESTSITGHETSRHLLLSKLQESIRRGDSGVIFPPQYGDLGEYVRSNYQLVYLPIPYTNNPDAKQLRNRFRPDATSYGKGKIVKIFQKDSLSKLVGIVNGQAKICLGLAFQAKTLINPPPFSVGGSVEMRKRANQTSMKYMKQGYDSVEIVVEDSVEMVCWNAAAIVPLLSL
jgi:hypothetical protein